MPNNVTYQEKCKANPQLDTNGHPVEYCYKPNGDRSNGKDLTDLGILAYHWVLSTVRIQNSVRCYGKQCTTQRFLKRLEVEIPYGPASLLPSTNQKELKSRS